MTFSNAKSAVTRWPAISIARPVSEARRYGPAGSVSVEVLPPTVKDSLTAVAIVLTAKATATGPAWMPSPSLIVAVAEKSPAMPALVIRKRPGAAADRHADVARAEEEAHVGGGDADDRRVVGGAEDLVGAGAGHALEGERAAELLAEDRDRLVGAGVESSTRTSGAASVMSTRKLTGSPAA